ncbi:MAG: HEAT repeat domain-containing protein, partial [Acutalibacteraceae bacterium]
MNLMDKKSEKNLLAAKEILRILSDIDKENFEIAEKFFDFSKEMDLSLLEGIKFQNLKNYSRSNMSTDWVSKHQEAHSEYFARYVLFLDALGENTACFMLEVNMNSMIISPEVKVPFKENLIYAFSLKYSLEDAHAKIAALVATGTNTYTTHRNANLSNSLLDMAKSQPLVCFKAADFCHEEYTDAKILLYTSALHCLEPIMEITDDNRVLAEKVREGIKSLHKYVLDKKKLNSASELDMVMIYSFMTYHHDMSLKEGILNQKRFTLKEFLRKVLNFISPEYLEKSMDDFLDILNFQRDKDFVLDCLQLFFKEIWGTYKVFQNLTDNINLFLTAIAKKYPKEYVDTMLSTKVYCNNTSLCDCYPMMYKILETVNPTAIETYHLDFGKDVLKLVIDMEIRDTKVDLGKGVIKLVMDSEVRDAKACKDLIKQYLYGEVSAKCLENFRGKLKDTRFLTNRKLLKACFDCHPDFKKRYLVLKSYQSLNAVWQLSTDFFDSYAEFIDALVSENLMLEERFFCYESVFEHCWDNESMTKFKKALVQKMVELHDVNHEDYHIFCPNGGDVIIRSVYVDYLDATNQDGANKDYLFEMFKDTSKEVRRAAAEAVSKHKEYEPDVLELLKAKKVSVREAGVDILIMWGAGNYKDILEEMSQKEKNAKLLDKINSAFDYDTLETNSSPLLLVETLLRNGRNQKVAWLYNNNLNDSVHLSNGNLAGTDYMQALLLCYAGMDTLGISANATFLVQELNQEELNRFAGDVFSAWLDDGASAKKKWVLYFCAIHGGHNIVEGILHYIKEWAENS